MRFEDAGGVADAGAEASAAVSGEAAAAATDAAKSTPGWRPSRLDAEDDQSSVVNMPVKRNLDDWCFAEHMDMPVLLQVTATYYIHRRPPTSHLSS